MQRLAFAGLPVAGSPKFDAIKTIQFQRTNITTGKDVMSFKSTKSWLQRLFEQLIDTVCQKGHPL